MHEIKALVDFLEAERVRNHWIDFNLAIHIPIDNLGDISAPARTAEGRAFPDPTGDQLKRSRRDFLSGLCNSDNDAFSPAPMAGLQRRAHHFGIARAVKRIIRTAIG